ncbi:hypothetical protein ACXR0O_25530 [Verrucomicrobiota bacterium sgz303538]
MRYILLLLLLSITACAKPADKTPAPVANAPGDTNPIVAALSHFKHIPDLFLPGTSATATSLLVNGQYATSKGFIGEGQLGSDVASENWTIPEDARQDMERRTDAKEAIDPSGFPDFIRIGTPDEKARGFPSAFSKHHPDVKASITLWPPGFSKDGKRVLVRFLFGPTPHGASAVYLLESKDGLWHVVHYKISYYA